MTIPSDKPEKTCKFCGKSVKNLGFHVANNHPNIMEQLEENYSPQAAKPNSTQPNTQASQSQGDLSSMVREKVETMLNIKIIQMLEKGASIEEIHRITNPPPQTQTTGLDDIKKLVEIQRLIVPQHLPPSTASEAVGTDWGAIIAAAMPIVGQLLTIRMKKPGDDINGFDEHRSDEETSIRILRPISEEITGDTEKPGSDSTESIDTGEAAERDSSGVAGIDESNK